MHKITDAARPRRASCGRCSGAGCFSAPGRIGGSSGVRWRRPLRRGRFTCWRGRLSRWPAVLLAISLRPGARSIWFFQRLALEIIGGAIFSLDMRQYGPELRELILRYAARLGRPSLADFLLPLAVPTPADFARARFRRRWRRLIDRIIADRAERHGEGAPRDLFDILAGADPEIPPALAAERLGDQIATIVVAGHETTAAALFWTLYLLAQHPDEQERLAAEIEPLGLTPDNASELLPGLVHTRAVVDEALRLYPPAFVIVRQALDDDLAGGVPVPEGSLVLIYPWILHRHPRFWRP